MGTGQGGGGRYGRGLAAPGYEVLDATFMGQDEIRGMVTEAGWPEAAKGMGSTAAYDMTAGGNEGVLLTQDGVLRGLASYGTSEVNNATNIYFIGAGGGGAGRETVRTVARLATERGTRMTTTATDASRGFWQRLGFSEIPGTAFFRMTIEETADFAAGG